MMSTTHALIGVAVASATFLVAPEYALPAVLGAYVGGLLPDADLPLAHRRTFHYPVYGPIVGVAAIGVALARPTPVTVAGAALLGAAGLHAALDVLGGGLELRPWEGTSDRAVYDHHRDRWLQPRRWVPYDGAPRDVVLAAAVAVPTVLIAPAWVDALVAVTLGVSVVYAIVRKRMVDVAEEASARAPAPVTDHLDTYWLGRDGE